VVWALERLPNERAYSALMDAVRNSNAPRAATIQLRGDQRVKNSLEAVFRTDLAIKSSSGTPQYLLECLVVELCAR